MSLSTAIERFWYSSSKLVWIFWPVSLIFLLMVKIKRALYQLKLIKSNCFEKPVLVVGNITLGGTGKTPFINQLVRMLAENKIKAGIVSRGFHSNVNSYPYQVIADDTASQVGDEAFMQYADLNVRSGLNIPIVIDPDRSQAVDYLIKTNDIDLVISDDGMQHYKMGRDIEVLLFDGERRFGNQLILPFGPLREPISRLKTIDFVIQNGLNKNDISAYSVHLKSSKLVHLKTRKEISTNDFSENKVSAIAGIGNPDRFFKSLEKICVVKSKAALADHYDFTSEDFKQFNDDIVVMTEKDASKCYSFATDNWYYLKVEMNFGKKLTNRLLESIKKVVNARVC
jgi:tetraacyldisaccharide 4'-kinase